MQHLTCPVCQLALEYQPDSRVLRCETGHSFDQAKQGYFNLLLPQHKKSKHPGDTADMVIARREFLDAGYYLPIADATSDLINAHANSIEHYSDLGCGEGYYTKHLHEGFGSVTTGIDISTPAIKTATRRSKDIRWLVASIAHLPLANQSQDLLTCLFCRLSSDEALRVLKPGALLLTADTGPQHLNSLRQQLYGDAGKQKADKALEAQAFNGFELIEERTLVHEINVDTPEQIANLLSMTPHYWRSTEQAKARVLALNSLQTKVEVHFCLYRKTA